jgi:hypothetical protein
VARRRRITFAQVRKFVMAASGAAAVLASQGLLSGQVENWVTGSLSALTAALVFLVPNAPPDPMEDIVALADRDARHRDPLH